MIELFLLAKQSDLDAETLLATQLALLEYTVRRFVLQYFKQCKTTSSVLCRTTHHV